jgi:hypothetical protein
VIPNFPSTSKTRQLDPHLKNKRRMFLEFIGGNSNDLTETPLTTMPYPEATPKRTGGICSTLTNIFSPGGAKSKNSSPSESSALYVDPDIAGKIKEEGTSETTTPNVNTLEDPTASASDAIMGSGENSTEVAPSGGKPNEAQTGTKIKSNAGSKGETLQDKVITEAVAGDTPEDLITGDGDDEENGAASGSLPSEILTNDPLLQELASGATQTAMARGGSPPTLPEEWTTVMDRKIEQKNRKVRKNKEHKQKKQAKLLCRQAKHGPAWAQRDGVLPISSGSVSGSPRHSSSDSNQNSQPQEIYEGGSNSNESPGEQGGHSDTELHVDPQNDLNLSGGSQGGGDDDTEKEGSNDGHCLDFS